MVAHILTWLLAGLIAGGVATHAWERRQLAGDIAALTARQADQLREAQAKLEELMQQVKTEREQRQALEREVAELRPRS